MSKMMNDLNKLNKTRDTSGSIVIDDTPDSLQPEPVIRERKGIYFIGFLVILLVAFSVVSMSASFKTLERLAKTEESSATLLLAFNQQENAIRTLRVLIRDKNSQELARIDKLQTKVQELSVLTQAREKEFKKVTAAYDSMEILTQGAIGDLKMADRLMLRKYILLNDQVKQLTDASLLIRTY